MARGAAALVPFFGDANHLLSISEACAGPSAPQACGQVERPLDVADVRLDLTTGKSSFRHVHIRSARSNLRHDVLNRQHSGGSVL